MAKKKKIKEKIKEGVREIKKKVEELEELEEALDDADEGGIFDEDLEDVDETLEVSDFDIGSTILTSAPSVDNWSGQDLEEAVRDEKRGRDRDWEPADEFAGGDVYTPNSGGGDAYIGAGSSDVYSAGGAGGGSDVYSASGDSAYQAGKENGKYDANVKDRGDGMKTYDQLRDERRSGPSMLEITGLKNDSKKKDRDNIDANQKYQGKMAA
ncbi:hypothetical protein HN935_02765 [archaeon]|jgi:hypothetical protein|nr:hypothetical protein [archaeon]